MSEWMDQVHWCFRHGFVFWLGGILEFWINPLCFWTPTYSFVTFWLLESELNKRRHVVVFFVRGHTKETLYGIQYCNHICSISTKARTMFKKWFNDLRGSLLYHFFFHLTSHNPGKGVQTLHHQQAPVSICGSFRWSAHSSAYSGAGIQARWFSPWWRLEICPTIPGRSFYPTLHYMLSKIVQVPIIHRRSLYWNVTCPFDCTQKIHMQVGPSGCPSSYSVMPPLHCGVPHSCHTIASVYRRATWNCLAASKWWLGLRGQQACEDWQAYCIQPGLGVLWKSSSPWMEMGCLS